MSSLECLKKLFFPNKYHFYIGIILMAIALILIDKYRKRDETKLIEGLVKRGDTCSKQNAGYIITRIIVGAIAMIPIVGPLLALLMYLLAFEPKMKFNGKWIALAVTGFVPVLGLIPAFITSLLIISNSC